MTMSPVETEPNKTCTNCGRVIGPEEHSMTNDMGTFCSTSCMSMRNMRTGDTVNEVGLN